MILSVISLQMKCNQLIRQKQELKFMADEAAASAGLCIDPHRFGEGELVLDKEKAIGTAQEIVKQNMPGKEVETKVLFVAAGAKGTAVTVILSCDNLKATSTYEFVAY